MANKSKRNVEIKKSPTAFYPYVKRNPFYILLIMSVVAFLIACASLGLNLSGYFNKTAQVVVKNNQDENAVSETESGLDDIRLRITKVESEVKDIQKEILENQFFLKNQLSYELNNGLYNLRYCCGGGTFGYDFFIKSSDGNLDDFGTTHYIDFSPSEEIKDVQVQKVSTIKSKYPVLKVVITTNLRKTEGIIFPRYNTDLGEYPLYDRLYDLYDPNMLYMTNITNDSNGYNIELEMKDIYTDATIKKVYHLVPTALGTFNLEE